jgi:hypothetical protein
VTTVSTPIFFFSPSLSLTKLGLYSAFPDHTTGDGVAWLLYLDAHIPARGLSAHHLSHPLQLNTTTNQPTTHSLSSCEVPLLKAKKLSTFLVNHTYTKSPLSHLLGSHCLRVGPPSFVRKASRLEPPLPPPFQLYRFFTFPTEAAFAAHCSHHVTSYLSATALLIVSF